MPMNDPDAHLYGEELQYLDEALIMWSAGESLADAQRPYADGGALPMGAVSYLAGMGYPHSAPTHSRGRRMDPSNSPVPGNAPVLGGDFGGIAEIDYDFASAAFGAVGASRFGSGASDLDLPPPPGKVRNPIPAFGLTISGEATPARKAGWVGLGVLLGWVGGAWMRGRRRR